MDKILPNFKEMPITGALNASNSWVWNFTLVRIFQAITDIDGNFSQVPDILNWLGRHDSICPKMREENLLLTETKEKD